MGKLENLGKAAALGAVAFVTSLHAFNRPTRREIKNRASHRSELSHRSDRPRHCAHLNHYFQRYHTETYNSPDNGLYVTDIEHYTHHLIFRCKPALIGMTKDGNEWALNELHDKIISTTKISYQSLHKEVQRAKKLWLGYYKENDSSIYDQLTASMEG